MKAPFKFRTPASLFDLRSRDSGVVHGLKKSRLTNLSPDNSTNRELTIKHDTTHYRHTMMLAGMSFSSSSSLSPQQHRHIGLSNPSCQRHQYLGQRSSPRQCCPASDSATWCIHHLQSEVIRRQWLSQCSTQKAHQQWQPDRRLYRQQPLWHHG